MPDKDQVAQLLAEAHRQLEPSISRIVRLVSDTENDGREPVKLLEVNPHTSPSGIVPIAFGADPPSVPYPSIIVDKILPQIIRQRWRSIGFEERPDINAMRQLCREVDLFHPQVDETVAARRTPSIRGLGPPETRRSQRAGASH